MRLLLAIETSTERASVALLRDGVVAANRQWHTGLAEGGRLLKEIFALLACAETPLETLDAFAVGIGPGQFTALRMAVATAQGLALPDRKPIIGIGSAYAAARALGREMPGYPITIVGDARRARLWVLSMPPPDTSDPATDPGVTALEANDVAAYLGTRATVIATADWPRLEALLDRVLPTTALLRRQPHYPTADDVGLIGWTRLQGGPPYPPAEPLYVHPPTAAIG